MDRCVVPLYLTFISTMWHPQQTWHVLKCMICLRVGFLKKINHFRDKSESFWKKMTWISTLIIVDRCVVPHQYLTSISTYGTPSRPDTFWNTWSASGWDFLRKLITFETNLNFLKNNTNLELITVDRCVIPQYLVFNLHHCNAAPPADLTRSETHDQPQGGIS